jgi:hypothetical protein
LLYQKHLLDPLQGFVIRYASHCFQPCHEFDEGGGVVCANIGLLRPMLLKKLVTKDDWEAILELGIGSQRPENVSLPATNKTRFTKTYNQRSHPLPFMKASASNLAPPRKAEKPDLEEAIEASEDEEVLMNKTVDSADEVLDLKKDKYVQAPKKRGRRLKKPLQKRKIRRLGRIYRMRLARRQS